MAEGEISKSLVGLLQVMSNTCGVVNCDETTWETGRGGLVLRNKGHMEASVVLGDIVGAAWSAPEEDCWQKEPEKMKTEPV